MAAGTTYTPIQSITASGSASSITFSSIPSTYTDLYLVCDVAYASLGGNIGYVVAQVGNGSVDTGSNYSYTYLTGNGTTPSSGRGTGSPYINLFTGVTGSTRAIINSSFQNYSNTTTYKTLLSRSNESADVYASVALWRSTSAINTIKIYDVSGYNFSSNSTFTLYGISCA